MKREFSLQDLINKKVSEREEREVKHWHCSRLGACPTGMYLERTGTKPDEEFDERTLRVFSCGKIFEDWLIDLVKNECQLEQQVRIEDTTLDVTGYADAVVTLPDGRKIVYEVKSKHSKAFWYMVEKGEGANKHHLRQLWFYLYNLGIEEGRLIYVSKDDLTIAEYPVYLKDKELGDSILAEIALLNDCLKAGLPPKPPTDPKDWRVKYCSFHKQCVNQKKYYEQAN